MYASITFKNTAESNLSDVVSDVVKVLTGETNKANLSAQVVQEATTIISTQAAGWAVEQTVSPTDVVLKAPISDDNTKFKYIRIFSGVFDGRTMVSWEAYQDWTVASTSGTVIKRRVASTFYDYPAQSGISFRNSIYATDTTNADQCKTMISASANHFVSCSHYGSSYIYYAGPSFLAEHTRNSAWDTVANGFEPYVVTALPLTSSVYNDSSTSSLYYLPFIKPSLPNGSGGVVTPSQSTYQQNRHGILTPMGSSEYGRPATHIRFDSMIGSNLQLTQQLMPFGCTRVLHRSQGGDISAKTGLYLAYLNDPGNPDDVFVHNGTNYRIMRLSNSNSGAGAPAENLVLLCTEA